MFNKNFWILKKIYIYKNSKLHLHVSIYRRISNYTLQFNVAIVVLMWPLEQRSKIVVYIFEIVTPFYSGDI